MSEDRVETVVFRVKDNNQFKVIWNFLKANATPMVWASGNRLYELERRLNVYAAFTEPYDCSDLWELSDKLAEEHGWKDYDNWDTHRVIEEVAKVWQPE